MYYRDHNPPHFHARYGGQRARFTIEDLHMLDGDMQPRARALVLEWARLRQPELRRDWELARAEQPLNPIAPLE